MSSEIFQKWLNEALESLTGVICVADDILVTGCGDTKVVAERDHDENWVKLQQRCLARRIKLNDDKTVLKQDNVAFMGHMITTERTRVDDGKLKAIMKVSAPTNVHGVKRFCGMIQYLARFTPDLTSDLVPIRSRTWQNAEWNW